MGYKYGASLREVENYNKDYTEKYDKTLPIDDMIRRYLQKQTGYHGTISPRSFDVAFLARIENLIQNAFIFSIIFLIGFVISGFIIGFKESIGYIEYTLIQIFIGASKAFEFELFKIAFITLFVLLIVKILFTYSDFRMNNSVSNEMLNEFEKSFMNSLQKQTIKGNLEILEGMTGVDDKTEERRQKLAEKYTKALELPGMIWEA